MTREAFMRYLRGRIDTEFGSQHAAAIGWGCSQPYLSDVLQGNRKPGKRLLASLGFQRVESYEEIDEAHV